MSNILITTDKPNSTGTWIGSMQRALRTHADVELGNISWSNDPKASGLTRCDYGTLAQWALPYEWPNRKGLPSSKTVEAIRHIVETFQPDLIHVWGVESYWGMLTANGQLGVKVLLEIQGLKGVYARVFYGGLSLRRIWATHGLVELQHPALSLLRMQREFRRWGKMEAHMIASHDFIHTQSDWVRAHVRALSEQPTLFETGILLRDEICQAAPWVDPCEGACLDAQTASVELLTVTSSLPHKGLHVSIRALAEVKKRWPKAKLRIAGIQPKQPDLRNMGYTRYLLGLIRRLGLEDSVEWLGHLNADQLIEAYRRASLFVLSSYVETYCLALAEALYVGLPSVVAYSSALPELADDGRSALFYPVGESVICAQKIERLLSDRPLAQRLAAEARREARIRNDRDRIVAGQLDTYRRMIHFDNM